MRLRLVLAAAAVVVLAAMSLPGAVLAQTAPTIGAVVKDKSGATLGVIVQVVTGPDGKPYQVLVRQGQVKRPLLVEGLSQKGAEYVSVLSKAEFEILPPAE